RQRNPMSFFKKLKDKLFSSSSKLDEGLDAIVEQSESAAEPAARPGLLGRILAREEDTAPRRILDDAMLEQLEELLIGADMGVETALRVTANMAEGQMGRSLSVAQIKG